MEMNADQMAFMQLKIVADNNALLRILLANQIKIMDKLGVDQELDHATYSSLTPLSPEIPLSPVQAHLKSVDLISQFVLQAANDWVTLNGNVSDEGADEHE